MNKVPKKYVWLDPAGNISVWANNKKSLRGYGYYKVDVDNYGAGEIKLSMTVRQCMLLVGFECLGEL